MADISRIVDVTATITAAAGGGTADFGSALLLTTDDTLPQTGSGKFESYDSFAAVGDDFAAASEPYRAAQTYFSQVPYPKPLVIGRWLHRAQGDVLTGAAPDSVADIQGVNNPTLIYAGTTISTLDFSADNSYSDIAGEIQTRLRAASVTDLADVVVEYDSVAGVFTLTFGFDSGSPIEAAAFTGTIAAELGIDSTATITSGYASESVAAVMSLAAQSGKAFYFILLDDAIADSGEAEEVSAWAETSTYQLILDTHESDTLDGTEGTYLEDINDAQRQRTTVIYSSESDYKSASAAARLSSVDFRQPGSLITLFGKLLPNTAADNLTGSQRDELEDQNCNYYAEFGGQAAFFEGQTAQDGIFIDTRYWVDWFVREVQSQVWALLRRSNAVPQTNAGVALVTEVVNRVCEQGRRNGGIAGGTLPETLAHQIRQATGSQFDGVVPNGYLVYVAPVSTLSDSDLAARTVPPIKVWLRGSGAIHNVQIDVSFN